MTVPHAGRKCVGARSPCPLAKARPQTPAAISTEPVTNADASEPRAVAIEPGAGPTSV